MLSLENTTAPSEASERAPALSVQRRATAASLAEQIGAAGRRSILLQGLSGLDDTAGASKTTDSNGTTAASAGASALGEAGPGDATPATVGGASGTLGYGEH